MESKNTLLLVTSAQIAEIRRTLNFGSQATIDADIDLVVEWYKKQQHLPRAELDRDLVERILLQRKGSVEQTKQKIDMMYTIRTMLPELALNRDILHPDIQKQFKAATFAVMPKLNSDLTRVNIYRYTPNVDEFVFYDTAKYVIMTLEYRFKYDYCLGDHYIIDYQYKKLQHLGKETPTGIKNCEIFMKKSYGVRVFGLHLINCPSFVDKILNLVKGGLSEKMRKRLFIHSSYEDLHKYINKECLPKDYGGYEPELQVIADAWKEELTKEPNRKYLIEQESLKSNESLRIGGKVTDESLGIAGTFKKLNVD